MPASPPSQSATTTVRPWMGWAAVAAVVLLGLALTAAIAIGRHRTERELEHLRFGQQSAVMVTAFENGIAAAVEEVRAEADFVRSHDELTLETFATFTRPAIDRLPQIRSMTWIEAVPAAEREAWEAKLRADGAADLGIVEVDAAGERRPAGDRPLYYPVRFIEPRESSSRSLGFDTGSSPARLAALERARDTGQPAATPIVPLMSDPDPRISLVLFVPVYRGEELLPETVKERRARLAGFTTGGFHVRLLLQQALRETAPGTLRLHLFDVSDPTPKPVITWPSQRGDDLPDVALLGAVERGELAASHDVEIGGRVWRIIATPGGRYRPITAGHPWIILASGLCVTALTAVLLVVGLRRNAHLHALAQTRAEHAARLQAEMREREAAQRALSRANEELRQLNAEMEQFVSAVSHDLKNPLLAIDWTVIALRKALDADKPDRARKSVDNLGQAASSMRRIIDDLIAHARAGWAGFEPQRVDLGTVVRRVLDERADHLARHAVRVEVQEPLPAVAGDAGRLTAALDNLVSNAVKYGTSASAPYIRIGCERGGGEVRLFVEDNGPGVDPEQRTDIFKLFHRGQADGEGTGIGLAIVERVARAHHGRAWVDDAPGGRGARFWIAFPDTGDGSPGAGTAAGAGGG